MVFIRPRVRDRQTIGFGHVSAAQVALLLIQCERCGLAVDPDPLVQALRPAALGKKLIAMPETRILWYQAERHRSEDTIVETERSSDAVRHEEHLLPTGYRATIGFDVSGAPVRLQVAAPGRRRRRVAA